MAKIPATLRRLLPLLPMALVLGAAAFELVGMKPDLGALILGVLLAKHDRAGEISVVKFCSFTCSE